MSAEWNDGVTSMVLSQVYDERSRQESKWGQQNHPDGTGRPDDGWVAEYAKEQTDKAASDGTITYRHILNEEVLEAYAETEPSRLRAELLQVAAVAVAWVEKIDRDLGSDQ